MESEIQPLIFVESAALAASAVRANAATTKIDARFTKNLQGNGIHKQVQSCAFPRLFGKGTTQSLW
jgi:hypothetical protein